MCLLMLSQKSVWYSLLPDSLDHLAESDHFHERLGPAYDRKWSFDQADDAICEASYGQKLVMRDVGNAYPKVKRGPIE